MTQYHPIVQFGRDIQQTLIPIEDRKPSLASACSHFIEDMTHIDENAPFMDKVMMEMGARVGVLAMPFFVSLSVIQLGGAFACHFTLMVVNWDWDFELLGDYLMQIAKMSLDVFAQVIVCPIAFVAPTVYQYDSYTPPKDPKDFTIETLKKELVDNEADYQAKLSEKDRVLAELDHALLPQVTLANFRDTIREIPGITAKVYDHGNNRRDLELNYSTWQNGGPDTIKINSIEKFLCPNDTLELSLDFTALDGNKDSLIRFLQKDHQIDRLIIKGEGDIDFLLDLPDEETTLHKIHTLVVLDFPIKKETLEKIAEKFPTIACYHLSGATIDEDLGDFRDRFICFERELPGGVSWGNPNNLQRLYDEFNQQLKEYIEGYSSAGFSSDYLKDMPNIKLRHPIAPFIRKVAFFRNTEIRDGHLAGIQRGIKKYFPNMRILDLSECTHLTVGVFKVCAHLHPQEVHFARCNKQLLFQPLNHDEIKQMLERRQLTVQEGDNRLVITKTGRTPEQIKAYLERIFPQGRGFELTYGTRNDVVHLKKVLRPAPDIFATYAIKYFINGGDYLKMNKVEGVYPLNDGIKTVVTALASRDLGRQTRVTYLNTDDGHDYHWNGDGS